MNTDFQQPSTNEGRRNRNLSSGWLSSQTIIGIAVVLFGLAIFLDRSNVNLPHWLTSWPMILVVVGALIGMKSGFKDVNWIIIMVIGGAFLVGDIFEDQGIKRFGWPVAIILVGLIIAFKPRLTRCRSFLHKNDDLPPAHSTWDNKQANPAGYSTQPAFEGENIQGEVLDIAAVFGGVKRNVMSKQFRGGEVVAVFGGAEINLTHADFDGVVRLEAVSVFGGTKLFVPPNWDVQSEMVAVFGGVEDKRIIRPELIDPRKKLVLEGTCFLGGLEIRNY